ncbi:MAG: oligosaccharide flippase family protein, partial [Oscillospiraceae bacterium]
MSGWKEHIDELQNTFFGRVVILSAGHTMAQLMPILLTPVITRLYTSSQLGDFALFVAAVNIITQFACLKYDFAITVAPNDDTAWQLLLLSVVFSVAFSALMLLLFPFYPSLLKLIGTENGVWLYLIPVGSLITATEISMVNYNIYAGRYNRVSKGNIIRGAVYCVAQIGLYNFGVAGLIVSQMVSNAVTIVYLAVGSKLGNIDKTMLKQIAFEYRAYPKYMVVGAVAGAANSNLQSFFISAFYGSTQTGYYAVVNRLLGTPLTVLSTAIGQVFLKQSAVEMQQKGKVTSAKKLTLW